MVTVEEYKSGKIFEIEVIKNTNAIITKKDLMEDSDILNGLSGCIILPALIINGSYSKKRMIDKEIHFARLWKVNEIANDFILWDVWEIPIVANNSKTENFQSFYGVAFEAFKKMQTKTTLVSILFTLRFWISKIFPFDKNINTLPIPGCQDTTIKTRLNGHDLEKSKVGKAIKVNDTDLEFCPVYLFEDESLHELSNDTVHGLIHIGWIKKNDNYYTATLAIYVIPRGIYGKVYLKLIEPFRRYIVYPGMMNAIKEQWQEYLLMEDSSTKK